MKVIEHSVWSKRTDQETIANVMDSRGGVVAWAYMKDDTVIRDHGGDICCAPMDRQMAQRNATNRLLFSLRAGECEYAEQWWEFVLDPAISPWHRVLHGVEVYRSEAGGKRNTVSIDIAKTTGYRDIVNLIIACRQTHERHPSVNLYYQYLASGVLPKDTPPSVSLAVYAMMSAGKYYAYPCRFSDGHGFLNWHQTCNMALLANRTPRTDDTRFRSSASYRASCDIWGDTRGRDELRERLQKLKQKPKDVADNTVFYHAPEYNVGGVGTDPSAIVEIFKKMEAP